MSCSQQVTRKIIYSKKNTVLVHKYIDDTWSPYWVSFLGLRLDFGKKNWKFPLCFFLPKISHEIIFDRHLL